MAYDYGFMAYDYGFTNNKERYDAAVAYRTAACADGWNCEPTYGEHEALERAARLTREGFVIKIISRKNVGKWEYEASVSIWGPDGLQIEPPERYEWNQIVANLKRCNHCHKVVDTTRRYSFAGRCCDKCLPEMRRVHEYPGWTR